MISERGKWEDPQEKKGLSKRKGDTFLVEQEICEQGPCPNMNLDDGNTSNQIIIDNMRVQIVLGGWTFDMDVM